MPRPPGASRPGKPGEPAAGTQSEPAAGAPQALRERTVPPRTIAAKAARPPTHVGGADATLALLGKGALEQEARALSVAQPSVTLEVDPPRPRIHSVLDDSRVLVLWSQPSPTWREQVGLPIVEGLS